MKTRPLLHSSTPVTRRAGLLLGLFVAGLAGCAAPPPRTPHEVTMMTSGAFAATAAELQPGYEASSGDRLHIVYGSSMGGASDSIPARLARNEPVDVVILARGSLDELVAQGKVVPGSQVDLVHSLIGFAVRKGAPKPDIGSVAAVRATLLAAPSIAYSASASGTYYQNEMLKKLGIEAEVKPKSKRILSERVGTVVARGDAELGLQQVSELLPIPGVDFVGVLPPELQRMTVFSAGISTSARDVEGARTLIRYFASPAVVPVLKRNGLESATAAKAP
ncbi:solute-binding protein [Xylophilus rhododendri]|uniref:Solute-binding protein n=1 Tax=Xylophilus rhododendri TaxID=2697032 RepID=A0A857J626_9BURK|nr:substrate-binding domain-containing protein [Xylophilus rhododendri]QHI98472.1 solute-binding protein [Xylophilus rhododendri]